MYPTIELRLFIRPHRIDPELRVFAFEHASDMLYADTLINFEDLVLICNEDLKLSEELTEWNQQQLERVTVLNEGTMFQQLLTGINLFEIPPDVTLESEYLDEYGLNKTFGDKTC